MRRARSRTSGSFVDSIIAQTFVNRVPQKPACSQSERSSVIEIPSPSVSF